MAVSIMPLGGIDITEDSTSANAVGTGVDGGKRGGLTLGVVAIGDDGTEWTRIKASAAVLDNAFVGIDENFAAAPLTKAMADDNWGIGIAQTAKTSGRYGWVATRGSNITGLVLKACAADAKLYTTSTAGVLDDSSASTQTLIGGAACVAAASASAPATGQAVEIIAQNGFQSGGFGAT